MPIREEVPKSPGRQVVSAQSLKDLATLAFEAGALAVGQSGAAIKDPRSVPLQTYPMLGRASNLVRATTEGDFGPIEVFGEQTPWPGSKQVHGELEFSGLANHYLKTEHINKADANTAHLEQGQGGWYEHRNATIDVAPSDEASFGHNILTWTVDADGADSVIGPQGSASGGDGTFRIQTVAGESYAVDMRMRGAVGTKVEIQVWPYDAATGGGTPGNFTASHEHTFSGEWEQVRFVFQNSDAAGYPYIATQLYAKPASAGDTFELDTYMIGEAHLIPTDRFIPSMKIVGKLQQEAVVACDDYTAASNQQIVSCRSSNTGYQFQILPTGAAYTRHGNGTSTRAVNFDPDTPFVDGQTYALKTLYDADALALLWVDGVQQTVEGIGVSGDAAPSTLFLSIGGLSADNFKGVMRGALVRDGEGPTAPIVAAFDAFDMYGLNIYEGQKFIDGVTGRTWEVVGDNWPASIDVIEDDLDDVFGGFDDYDAAVELNGVDQFIQTEHINELSSDNAHVFQSQGDWENYISGVASVVDESYAWSGKALSVVVDTNGQSSGIRSSQAGRALVVEPNVTRWFSCDVYSEQARSFKMTVNPFFDDNSAAPGTTVHMVHGGTGWEHFDGSYLFTTADLVYGMMHIILWNGDPDDDYKVANMMWSLEKQGEFVPSYKVVGEVDIEIEVEAEFSVEQYQFARLIGMRSTAANRFGGFNLVSRNDVGAVRCEWAGAVDNTQSLDADGLIPDDVKSVLRFVADGTNWRYELDGVPFGSGATMTFDVGGNYVPINIGRDSYVENYYLKGQVSRVTFRDGEDGPVVLNFDAKNMKEVGALAPGFSHMGEDGRLWTFPNGATMKWTPKL